MASKDRHYLYEIKNRVNDKRYFGVTNNIKSRTYWHQKNLADGNHSNSHLQRAYDLYGPNSFEYNIIGITSNELNICIDEMALIWRHYPHCYNKLLGVPWTKYTPQTSIKKEIKDDRRPLLMARIKRANNKKKKAKAERKANKARKRRERKEMLKRTHAEANRKLKEKKQPVINKITEDDMHELRLDSIILKALRELKE
jgi:hypothetical protein